MWIASTSPQWNQSQYVVAVNFMQSFLNFSKRCNFQTFWKTHCCSKFRLCTCLFKFLTVRNFLWCKEWKRNHPQIHKIFDHIGPIKVNQKMAFFGSEIKKTWKMKYWVGLETVNWKLRFQTWDSMRILMSVLTLFSAIADC